MASSTLSHTAVSPINSMPAWKRLGLKLKIDQDIPDPTTESPKRKRADEARDLAPVKRSKDSLSLPNSTTPSSKCSDEKLKKQYRPEKKTEKAKQQSAEDSALLQEHEERPLKARGSKSVTFAPETKVDDGDSVKQLLTAWTAEQKAKDPTFDARDSAAYTIHETSEVSEEVDNSLPEPERRVERVKKKAKTASKSKKTADKSPKLDGALLYLDQFCNAKDNWRFNKKHQTTLLKNIFNLNLVPSDHIEQLYTYIKGLQGLARKTLRDSALAIKIADLDMSSENVDDPSQKLYDAALSEAVSTDAGPAIGSEKGVILGLSDPTLKERLAKRLRAERIISEVTQDAETTSSSSRTAETQSEVEGESSSKRVKMENGKVARRRKQRTSEVIDDDSSTSSSPSESDSDSDDSGENEEGKGVAEELTTSSESTSSSEGTDSEDSSNESDESEDGSESE